VRPALLHGACEQLDRGVLVEVVEAAVQLAALAQDRRGDLAQTGGVQPDVDRVPVEVEGTHLASQLQQAAVGEEGAALTAQGGVDQVEVVEQLVRQALLGCWRDYDAGAATAAGYAFVGDSGNDAACFAAFRVTFGVANVRKHLARIPVTPKYVATSEMGDGFAEIARAIILTRRSGD